MVGTLTFLNFKECTFFYIDNRWTIFQYTLFTCFPIYTHSNFQSSLSLTPFHFWMVWLSYINYKSIKSLIIDESLLLLVLIHFYFTSNIHLLSNSYQLKIDLWVYWKNNWSYFSLLMKSKFYECLLPLVFYVDIGFRERIGDYFFECMIQGRSSFHLHISNKKFVNQA